jgi:hypothetical protein
MAPKTKPRTATTLGLTALQFDDVNVTLTTDFRNGTHNIICDLTHLTPQRRGIDRELCGFKDVDTYMRKVCWLLLVYYVVHNMRSLRRVCTRS